MKKVVMGLFVALLIVSCYNPNIDELVNYEIRLYNNTSETVSYSYGDRPTVIHYLESGEKRVHRLPRRYNVKFSPPWDKITADYESDYISIYIFE